MTFRNTILAGEELVRTGMRSPNYVAGLIGWRIARDGSVEFNNGTFRGTITASAIDIGGADATSFHVDIDGNLWLGAATFAAAPFKVANTGSLTVTGGSITGTLITGGTLQTATFGARVVISAGGAGVIEFYNTGGALSGTLSGRADWGGGNLRVNTSFDVSGILQGFGRIDALAGLTVSGGAAQITGGITNPFGNVAINDNLDVSGNTTMSGNLTLAAGTSLTLSSGLVTRGSVDSGGAGFRLLRVPN